MKKITLSLILLLLTRILSAQQLVLDPTFNVNGKYHLDYGFQDNLQTVAVQADGKIIAAGTALNTSFAGRLLVTRINTNGTIDSSFGTQGSVLIQDYNESYAFDCFVKSDGKIVVIGSFADNQYEFSMLAIRLNSDGSLDNNFGTNGKAEIDASEFMDDFAYSAVELADHSIILAGTAQDSLFKNIPTIVKINENGSIITSFGNNGFATISVEETDNKLNSVLVQADGKIIVSGHYGRPVSTTGQVNLDVLLARFNANGILDSTFGNLGVVIKAIFATDDYVDEVNGMALAADGSIWLGGYTTQPDVTFDFLMMKYNANGTLDNSFDTDGISIWGMFAQDVIYDLKIAENKIHAAGCTGGFFFDDRDFWYSRYNLDGTIDNTFSTQGYITTTVLSSFDEANALAVNNGKVILAGKTAGSTNNDIAIIRYAAGNANGINNQSEVSIKIYPNPSQAGGKVYLSGLSNNETKNVKLISMLGTELATYTFNGIHTNYELELPNLAKGYYFLQVENSIFKLSIQ